MEILRPMHPRRAIIMQAIMDRPNITYKHLAEMLGTSNAVIVHHIKILTEKGMLENKAAKGERNDFKVLGFSDPPMEPYYKLPKEDV
jgi:predicted ArsR family transcriptional regulator